MTPPMHDNKWGGRGTLLTLALVAALVTLPMVAKADSDWPAPYYTILNSGNPDSLQSKARTPLAEGSSHSIRIRFQARNIHVPDFLDYTGSDNRTAFNTWVASTCKGGPAQWRWGGCYAPKPNPSPHRPLIDPYIEVDLGTVDSSAWTITASSYPSSTGASWDYGGPQGPVLEHYEHYVTLTIMAVNDTCRGETPHTITVKIKGDDPLRDLKSETFTIKKKDNDLLGSAC